MYLNKFILKNFQIHIDTPIELTDGINVIVGPTDHGKSSIYRAAKSLFLNNIKLDRKITHGLKNGVCEIEARGEFGKIKRIKGKSKNFYYLNKEELKGFGQGSVSDVLKFTKVTDINFQSQHDSPFLLGASGGEVAKYLNKIINLEVIDTTLSNLKSAEEDATRKVKSYGEQEQEKLQELKAFDNLNELEDDLTVIEEIQQELEELEDIVDLNRLVDRLADALDILDVLDEANFNEISGTKLKLDELDQLESEIEELEELSEEVYKCQERCTESIDASEIVELSNEYQKVNNEVIELMVLIDQLEDLIDKDNYDSVLKELRDELHELSPSCPTCGGSWK
jgi:exonuclease SbcC